MEWFLIASRPWVKRNWGRCRGAEEENPGWRARPDQEGWGLTVCVVDRMANRLGMSGVSLGKKLEVWMRDKARKSRALTFITVGRVKCYHYCRPIRASIAS